MFARRFQLKHAEAFVIFVAFFLLTMTVRNHAFTQMYMARDLDRAYLLLQGQHILFGPELSDGGHLPGGFFYYLLAFFLAFPGGWENAFVGISVLAGAAAAFSYTWLRARLGLWALAGAVLIWPFVGGIRASIVYFGNPSFLPVFVAVVLIGILALFTGQTSNRRRTFAVTAIAVALGVQLHMTVLLLVLTALLLQLAPARLGLTRLRWPEVRTGLWLAALIFVPWLTWKVAGLNGTRLGQPPLVTAISDQAFEDSSSVENAELRSFGKSFRRGFLNYAVTVRPGAFYIFALLAALTLVWPRPGRIDEAALTRQIGILLLTIFISTLPVVAMDRNRYFLVASMALALLLPLLLEKLRSRNLRWQLGILVPLLLIAVYWRTLPNFPPSTPLLVVGESKKISRIVHEQTGWSFSEARERLFFVGPHGGSSLRYAYGREEAKASSPDASIDGYFIVKTYPGPAELLLKDPKQWIANELAPQLSTALRTGAIAVGEPIASDRPFSRIQRHRTRTYVIPYSVKDDNLPPYFQNKFEEYSALQPREIADLERRAAEQPNQTAIAIFNSCTTQPEWCRVAISAESEDLRDPAKAVRVRILGLPMSFISRRVSAGWNQMLERPFVTRECTSGARHRTEIVDYVGLPGLANPLSRYYTWMSPLTRNLRKVDCKRVHKIVLGFSGSEGSDLKRSLKISGDQRETALAN